ncbi:hypothetical protein WMY93_019283 [Mugilogobius chulae]|uniref:Transmembrane protein 54 n=1 Tax=Mugilogobius chulae TaxID=88201 RepID=A0AAW0NIQ0_9GOBI
MKMGLTVILIGHINFMLAALVQGVVLRHINFQKHFRAMEYAISTVMALTAGLVGIIVGILTIVLAKNKKSRSLNWSVLVLSLAAAILAGVSALGLLVAVAMAIKHNGRSLLSHCRFPDAIGYSSVTNECPFDPTRIYSTTLMLWLPLIVTTVVQLVFTSRCFTVTVSFLGLPCCCPLKKRPKSFRRSINAVKPLEADSPYLTSPRTTSTLLPSSSPAQPLLPSDAAPPPRPLYPRLPPATAATAVGPALSAPLPLWSSTQRAPHASATAGPNPLNLPDSLLTWKPLPGRNETVQKPAAPLLLSMCPDSIRTLRPRPRGSHWPNHGDRGTIRNGLGVPAQDRSRQRSTNY